MKLSRKDWPHIRMGGSAFLLSLGLGGAFILLSENYLTDAHITQRSSQQQLNEARKQLTGAREDRDNMDAYTTEYSVLLNHNILSTNQRLDWLEGLDKLKQQNHVLDFKYTISPQQNFAPNPPWDNGNFDLKQSAMTVKPRPILSTNQRPIFSTFSVF